MVGLLAVAVLCTAPPAGAAAADSLAALYQQGRSWTEFLAGANARRDAWVGNYRDGEADSAAVQRVRQLAGRWRLLVVAEDWCSDSVNTLPYVARLAEAGSALEIRIIGSAVGRAVMASHPTPDGRAATPTMIVIDEEGREAGCFVERPAALRAWLAAGGGRNKAEWYREDRGRSTVTDLLDQLGAASARRLDGPNPDGEAGYRCTVR
ncbi:MAG: thioredoxin family protein [Gemmatimonadales bacterium]